MFLCVCRAAVTKVQFLDGTTLASSSNDGTTRLWDTATDDPKEELKEQRRESPLGMEKEELREQRVGQFLVAAKDAVHDTDGAADVREKQPGAFFRAPDPIDKIRCAGDKIGVCCRNGAVLLLRAAWLTMTL
jgi:hypothetical protein